MRKQIQKGHHSRIVFRGAVPVIRECRLVGTVSRAADQHEAAVAIAAVDVAGLVDLEVDARVAERGGDAVVRAVARDAGLGGAGDLQGRVHGARGSKGRSA